MHLKVKKMQKYTAMGSVVSMHFYKAKVRPSTFEYVLLLINIDFCITSQAYTFSA